MAHVDTHLKVARVLAAGNSLHVGTSLTVPLAVVGWSHPKPLTPGLLPVTESMRRVLEGFPSSSSAL